MTEAGQPIGCPLVFILRDIRVGRGNCLRKGCAFKTHPFAGYMYLCLICLPDSCGIAKQFVISLHLMRTE